MIEYSLDDLQAFAAYEGRDPVTLHVAQVARTALAHGEALEAEVERLRALLNHVTADAGAAHLSVGLLDALLGERDGRVAPS